MNRTTIPGSRKVLIVFGTRPEAIKLAPVIRELSGRPEFTPVICVTAQHRQMLDQVLTLFRIRPDYDLNIMRDNQSVFDVTVQSLTRLGEVMERERPDVVLVQGDTTTVMTGALAAYYLRIPIGHVEAGLRTGDKYNPFPEEINRVFADLVADLLFAPTEGAKQNLLGQGVDPGRIFVTGNTAVDALLDVVGRLTNMDGADGMLEGLPESLLGRLRDNGATRRLVLVTGHRRESFGEDLENICMALGEIARRNPDVEVVYPVHLNPNVRNPVHRILGGSQRVHLLEPLGYVPFVWLMKRSYLVLTDSGGIQEEAPSLGKPTLVMRKVTERPEGIEAGAAALVGVETDSILAATQRLLDNGDVYRSMSAVRNPYGDGRASGRIADILHEWLGSRA